MDQSPQSAVISVPRRGRAPVILPNGKPLNDARNLAKTKLAEAKAVFRTNRDADKLAKANVKLATKAEAEATKALAAAEAATYESKDAKKTAIAQAKQKAKDAKAAVKAATSAEAKTSKALSTATEKLRKAEEAKLEVETLRLSMSSQGTAAN